METKTNKPQNDFIITIPSLVINDTKIPEENIVIPQAKHAKLSYEKPLLNIDTLIQGLNSVESETVKKTLTTFLDEIERIQKQVVANGFEFRKKCIIEEYLSVSPHCNELFTLLNKGMKDDDITRLVFEIFAGILTINNFKKTAYANDFLARNLIKTRSQLLHKSIISKDISERAAGSKLLLALAKMGPSIARFLVTSTNFSMFKFAKAATPHYKKTADGEKMVARSQDPRTFIVRFCIEMLSTGVTQITRIFMANTNLFGHLFMHLSVDPEPVILNVMSTIAQHIILNADIPIKEKQTFFKPDFLSTFVSLIKKGDEKFSDSVVEFLSAIIDVLSGDINDILLDMTNKEHKSSKQQQRYASDFRHEKEFTVQDIFVPIKTARESTVTDLITFLKPTTYGEKAQRLVIKALRNFPQLAFDHLVKFSDFHVILSPQWLKTTSFFIYAKKSIILPKMSIEGRTATGEQKRPELTLVNPLLRFISPMEKIILDCGLTNKSIFVLSRSLDVLTVIMKQVVKVLNALDEKDGAVWGAFRSTLRGNLKSALPGVYTLNYTRARALVQEPKKCSFILGQYYVVMGLYLKAFPELITEENFNFQNLFLDCNVLDELGKYRLLTLMDSIPWIPVDFVPIFNGLHLMTLPGTHPLVQNRAKAYMFKVLSAFGVLPSNEIGNIELLLWTSVMSSEECTTFFRKIMKLTFDKTGYYAAKTNSLIGRILLCANDLISSPPGGTDEDLIKRQRLYYRTICALLDPYMKDEERGILPQSEDISSTNFLLMVRTVRNEVNLKKSLRELQSQLFPAALFSIVYYLSDTAPDLAVTLIEEVSKSYQILLRENLLSQNIAKLTSFGLLANVDKVKKIVETSTANVDFLQKLFKDLDCGGCRIFGTLIGKLVGSSERGTLFAEEFIRYCPPEVLRSFIENAAADEKREPFINFFATALEISVKRGTVFGFITKEIFKKIINYALSPSTSIRWVELDYSIRVILGHSKMNNTFVKCDFDIFEECAEEIKAYTEKFFAYKGLTQDHVQSMIYFIESANSAEPVIEFFTKFWRARLQLPVAQVIPILEAVFSILAKYKERIPGEEVIIPAVVSVVSRHPNENTRAILRNVLSVASPRVALKNITMSIEYLNGKLNNSDNESILLLEFLLEFIDEIQQNGEITMDVEENKEEVNNEENKKEDINEESKKGVDNNEEDKKDNINEDNNEVNNEDKKDDNNEDKKDDDNNEDKKDDNNDNNNDIKEEEEEDDEKEEGTKSKPMKIREDFYVYCLESLFNVITMNQDSVQDKITILVSILRRHIEWIPIKKLQKKDNRAGGVLIKLLCLIAKAPTRKDLIVFAKEAIKRVFTDCKKMRRHNRLASINEIIVKSIESYNRFDVSWGDVAGLLYTIYSLEPTLCESGIDVVMLSLAEEYTVTLSKKDRRIFYTLKFIDKNGTHLSRIGYAWGRHARYIYDDPKTNIFTAIFSEESDLLNQEIIDNTINNYPINRKMDEDESIMNEDDVTTATTTTFTIDNRKYTDDYNDNEDNENDDNRESDPETEVYDPAYLLPILLNVVNNLPIQGTKLFISQKMLSLVLCSLSSEDDTLLKLGYAILHNYVDILLDSRVNERKQITYLIEHIRNSITSKDVRFPLVHSLFMAKIAPVITQPSSYMYKDFNKYLVSMPKEDFNKIPFINIALNSCENISIAIKERLWIFELVSISMRPSMNVL